MDVGALQARLPPSLSRCEVKRHDGRRVAEAPCPTAEPNTSLVALCPSRDYHLCFGESLSSRYLLLQPWTGKTPAHLLPPPAMVPKWFALGAHPRSCAPRNGRKREKMSTARCRCL